MKTLKDIFLNQQEFDITQNKINLEYLCYDFNIQK